MISLDYPSLLTSTNVKAFLRCIREGESNQVDDGLYSAYRMRYHPTKRVYLDGALVGGHPRIYEQLPNNSSLRSSAFGAYQHTATTWDAINAKYGLADDIRPYSQDCHAVALIHDVGALDDVIDGRLEEAVAKCGRVWASLPGSTLEDGGSKVAWDRLRAVWTRYGGNVPVVLDRATDDRRDAPAPIEDRSRPLGADTAPTGRADEGQAMTPALFVLPLLQSLFEAFSPVLRAKVTKTLDKQVGDPVASAQVADALMGIVKNVASGAGVPLGAAIPAAPATAAATADPVIAVATVKASPALVAEAEAAISSYIDQISPLLEQMDRLEQAAWQASEASMAAAAERAASDPGASEARKWLIASGVGMVAFLLVFVCALLAVQTYRGIEVGTEIWAALTGLLGWVTAKAGTLWDYYFGSSRSSQTKDFAIAELSTRKR